MKETKILALSTLRRRSGGDELLKLWSLEAAFTVLAYLGLRPHYVPPSGMGRFQS